MGKRTYSAPNSRGMTGPQPAEPGRYTLGLLPWALDQLERAYFRDFQGTLAAIREHPGYSLHDSMSAVRATFHLFEGGVIGLRSTLDVFRTEARSGGLFQRRGRSRLEDLEHQAQKGVFMAAQAAMALVDHTRRLAQRITIPGYDERVRKEFAENEVHRFIQDLRNHLAHVCLTKPRWQVSTSFSGEWKAEFLLMPDDLTTSGDWHALSRQFLASHAGGVNLETLCVEYANKVSRFNEWFVASAYAMVGDTVADYLRYERHLKAVASRSAWNVILRQIVIAGHLDPYQYLDRYLTTSELREIQSFKMRSRQQVDRIIELVDEHEACDEDLRPTVYQVFGVGAP